MNKILNTDNDRTTILIRFIVGLLSGALSSNFLHALSLARGKKTPNVKLDTIEALAKALKVKPIDFFG